MPVSKQRKRKGGPPPAALVPTRRVRLAYAEATDPATQQADLDAATVALEAGLDSGSAKLAMAGAYRALSLSPLCVAAYEVLAEESRDGADAVDLLRRGLHAAVLCEAGGAAPEASLTVRYALALSLLELEDGEDEAMNHLRDLIRLDPADEPGVRYILAPYLLDQHDIEEARTLLSAYPEDRSTPWLYARLLLAYRDERQAAPETEALRQAALSANPHVPPILSGATPHSRSRAEATPGSVEEATDYAEMFEAAWTSTPGAVAWLADAAGTQA